MRLFGFNIERAKEPDLPTFALPENKDGALEATSAGGAFASYLNMEGSAKNEADLVTKYREMMIHPECDLAVENILQEAIITNQQQSGTPSAVTVDVSKTTFSNPRPRIDNRTSAIKKLGIARTISATLIIKLSTKPPK